MMRPFHRSYGFSLIELMIAMTIGLILTSLLAVVFQSVSKANNEQFKAAEQQENGRFAMEMLSNDLRTAGYYGEFGDVPPAGASLPDPCTVPGEADINSSTANSPMAFYIQGYAASAVSTRASIPAGCGTWIDNATLRPGSDIVVVRRLLTTPLNDAGAADSEADVGVVYAQTTATQLSIQYGTGADTALRDADDSPILPFPLNAKGVVTVLKRKDFDQATAGSPPTRPSTAAYIRKLVVHVYFVANCREGSGSGGKCTASDDTIPTLKRLELSAEDDDGDEDTPNVPAFSVVPLVEGIEFMKIYYGLDTSSSISGHTVDGIVDSVVSAPGTVADWQNVVMAEVRLVARNVNPTSNYSDTKSYELGNENYDLGLVTFTPSGSDAAFKRHSFVSRSYIENVAGRREFTP